MVFDYISATYVFSKLPTYLDPGSGSFLLQLLLAFLFGSLFLLKAFWKRILSIFHRASPPSDDPNDESQ